MLTLAYQTAEGLATKAMGAAACGRRRILGHKKQVTVVTYQY